MDINARILNDTIEQHLTPLRNALNALSERLEDYRSASESSGAAGKMRKGISTQPPRYDGQYKYLTDKQFPAYGRDGKWYKFSDDTEVV